MTPARRLRAQTPRRPISIFVDDERGAALLEFAFVMPLLVVMAAGIYSFGSVCVMKNKLAEVARDGARIAAGGPRDFGSATCTIGASTYNAPCSVASAMTAITSELSAFKMTDCTVNPAATALGDYAWSYSSSSSGCGGNPIVQIERNDQVVSGGVTLFVTRVTVNYPDSWDFASVLKLIAPSSSLPSSFWLTAQAVMPNLS
jgi:Flp pilus assembly protein TadG